MAPLIVHQECPLNAEPPLDRLGEGYLTPNPFFFVRSHVPAPDLDPRSWRLEVDGLVRHELHLSLEALRSDFEPAEITATLHCAGNRRDELMAVRPIPGEVPWGAGAVGTARWRGVRLRDVLSTAGLEGAARHVELTGLDRVTKDERTFGFGGSVPVEKATSESVLLAWEMNGEPLPRDHGSPLRAVVPGYIGARSVKWLGRITARERPSENHYQARSYKLFPPGVDAESVDWEEGLTLGELPVNAVITRPGPGGTVRAGPVRVEGYALAGGERTVERVDVSSDGGRTWRVARFRARRGAPAAAGAWRLWSVELELPPGEHELVARAWDSAAGTQPERVPPIWNFKGYMCNAWHRASVRVEGS